MTVLTRADQSVLGKWWWTVDRWILFSLGLIVGFGIVLIQAATPAVAVKHGLDNFYFVERHLIMLVPALMMTFFISLLNPRQIRWLSIALVCVFLPLLFATLFIGQEIKGAMRWIQLPGFSLQPSEFIKPALAVVAAWFFSRQCENRGFPSIFSNMALFGCTILCLLSQPDIGMTVLTSAIWFGEFFLAGLPLIWVGICAAGGALALLGAYYIFPHFTSRMDKFLNHSGDTYQVDRSLDAFMNGGLWGTGPGEGTVKMSIPDAHADFVFAVAGEELGLLWCLFIIGLFVFVVLRGFWRLKSENNLFIMLAVSGLLIEFGLQTVINLASTMRLMPAKGMTLPFISYGGSSLWALAIAMGMLLALTRKRYGMTEI